MFIHKLRSKRKQRRLIRKGFLTAGKRRTATDETRPENSVSNRFRYVTAILIIFAGLAVAASILYKRPFVTQDNNVVGQKAPSNIYSEVPSEYINLKKTGFNWKQEKPKIYAEKLQELQQNRLDMRGVLAYTGLAFLLVLTGAYGLAHITSGEFTENSKIVLVAFVFILQVALSRVTMDIYYLNYDSSVYLYSLIPFALSALLLAQLMSIPVAIWVGLFTSVASGLQGFEPFQAVIVGSVASFVGAAFAGNARTRFHFLRAGVAVAVAIFAVNALFAVINQLPLDLMLRLALFSLLNGVVTAVVASTILPVLEYIFGLTTDISLLELSDRNHPLLKKLQLNAPGTYHHSLIVATLAEQSASAIGANPLLARVCAYFHDIGKLSQPEYFIENISMGNNQNPHDKLQPRMSTLVLLNHVKGGLEMAKKHKLKRIIREAIAQHHGTSLIHFFYQRAQKNADTKPGESNVDQQDYRYPGPSPQRKEIALISIADSCEAASRSLQKPTPKKIEEMVEKIVLDRVKDGQLDNADLTFCEVATVKQVTAKTLGNMLHPRINYDNEQQHENQYLQYS